MLNECSKYLVMSDESMKFHAGDKVCRKGDEMMTCFHYEVLGVFLEKHPFYEQVWYMLKNFRGQNVTSLPQNMEDFVKLN